MVYVTHDQIEVMTLATKIVVMQGASFSRLDPAKFIAGPATLQQISWAHRNEPDP